MLYNMTLAVLALCLWTGFEDKGETKASKRSQQGEETKASPIALPHDNRFVWTVNPDSMAILGRTARHRKPDDASIGDAGFRSDLDTITAGGGIRVRSTA